MEYSFIAIMYRAFDDYEFGIEVKVKKSDIISYRSPLWVLAAKKATEEARKLEAELISLEKLEIESITMQ